MSLKGGIFTVLECSIQPSSEQLFVSLRETPSLVLCWFRVPWLATHQHTSAKMTHSFALLQIFVSFLGGKGQVAGERVLVAIKGSALKQ